MRSMKIGVLLFIIFGLMPKISNASLAVAECGSGSIVGHPPINQIPTYDYSEDGLVQFHFHFSEPEWNYNTLKVGLYNDDCILLSEPGRGQVGGVTLPPASNIVVKVTEFDPDKFNFKVYDDDTGEFFGTGLGFVPNDFNSPKINITLSSVTGNYYNPNIDIVTTPTVAMRKTTQELEREPVLIIPGAMGTELFDGPELLWPNVNKMVTDIGDDFLDPLSFNPDLKPSSERISEGDLVKEPFYGEHYYDTLIENLVSEGYAENQNLFVFPYDWRFGVSEEIVSDLNQRINNLAGSSKLNVIAHSAGGLLLKKVVQNYGGSKIDKAIMLGVPNYGAPQAIKILLFGDSLGIPWLNKSEIKKISQNMPIMYDLAPTSSYGSYFNGMDFETLQNYMVNGLDLNLLATERARTLHDSGFDNFSLKDSGINTYNFVGCGIPTLSSIYQITQPVSQTTLPYDLQKVFGSGDGTVPIKSSVGNNDNTEQFYVLDANHGKFASQLNVIESIKQILQNNSSEVSSINKITKNVEECSLQGKLVSIFGRVEGLTVKNSNGEVVFPQPENSLNSANFQISEQENLNLIYLAGNYLADKIEFTSLSETEPVHIQIDSIAGVLGDTNTLNLFQNNNVRQNSVVSLSQINSTEPILSFESKTVSISPENSLSSSSSGSSASVQPVLEPIGAGLSSFGSYITHPESSLIRFGPTIYIVEQGQRRGFRDYGEFLSYGYADNQVEEGNIADWNLPEGLIKLAKPEVLAQDINTPNEFYFLNSGLEKQKISNDAMMQYMMSKYLNIFQINLENYRVGENL